MRNLLFFGLFTCTLFVACTCGNNKENTDAPSPATYSKALYHNPDSLLRYAKLAYLEMDAHALYVTGSAARLALRSDWPDSCTAVKPDEGDIMLALSARMGYQPAIDLIRCLEYHNDWHHSVPETLEKER